MLAELERDRGPAARLPRPHGGTRIDPGRRRKAGKPAGGQPLWDWLVARFGAGALDVPLGPAAHRIRIAWTVATMERGGASAQEIATRLGITTRSVARHRHRLHQRAYLTASTRKPAR